MIVLVRNDMNPFRMGRKALFTTRKAERWQKEFVNGFIINLIKDTLAKNKDCSERNR